MRLHQVMPALSESSHQVSVWTGLHSMDTHYLPHMYIEQSLKYHLMDSNGKFTAVQLKVAGGQMNPLEDKLSGDNCTVPIILKYAVHASVITYINLLATALACIDNIIPKDTHHHIIPIVA